MILCPAPQGFSRFLFDCENKSLGVSPGSTPRKANDKCIRERFNCCLCHIYSTFKSVRLITTSFTHLNILSGVILCFSFLFLINKANGLQ